ncbi:MAG TPA: GGDEF domain-containing protein [Mycobacteriales bacterium]
MGTLATGVRRRWAVVAALAVAAVGYVVVPATEPLQDAYYNAVAVATLAVAVAGLVLNRPRPLRVWVLVLGAAACWVVGDLTWSVLWTVFHLDPFPSVADGLYLAGYPLMAAGLATLVRRRTPVPDRAGTLDAAIIATGAGVVATVFVVVPTLTDATQGLAGRLVGTAYPIGDLLLLAVLAKLWISRGRTRTSVTALGVALAFGLVGDISYNLYTVTGNDTPAIPWTDACLLLCYVGLAAATLHPTVRTPVDPGGPPGRESSAARLIGLTVASLLPPITLLIEGVRGQEAPWGVVGVGSVLLSVLVLVRMAGLLREVQRQSVQLEILARDDGLTGIPNRRTWDRELARACAEGGPLWVALLDLDHFKDYNDSSGHAAGDVLLRDATAAWTAVLPAEAFLARYGGEEFAVLVRGGTEAQARALLGAMQSMTPRGQTFSAGLAAWDLAEEPADLVARADAALYEAKGAGRARVRSAGVHS